MNFLNTIPYLFTIFIHQHNVYSCWNKNPNLTKTPCRLELSVNVIFEYFFITDLSGCCHKNEANVVELSS